MFYAGINNKMCRYTYVDINIIYICSECILNCKEQCKNTQIDPLSFITYKNNIFFYLNKIPPYFINMVHNISYILQYLMNVYND